MTNQSAVTARARVDPITFAVVRNGLIAAARVGASTLQRTALNPIIYEQLDFAVSLFDSELQCIGEAPGLPIFSGSMTIALPAMVNAIGRDRLRPGDTLISNHSSLTGAHTPDVAIVQPVFVSEEIVAFVAVRAHIGDTGGNGMTAASSDIFQEGLLIPTLKLYDAGHVDPTLMAVIRANSRTPEVTAGNTIAAATGARAAGDAVAALIERYGVAAYRDVVEEILDHGERMARIGVSRIPDGVYSAEGSIDDNGVERGVPVKLRVKVTIAGDRMIVDTTGSAPQQASGVNSPLAYTLAAIRMAFKTLVTPDLSSNSGEYRALEVIAPEGSIFNPDQNAPASLSMMSCVPMSDLVLDALATALPDEVPAPSGGESGLACMLVHPVSGRTGITLCLTGVGLGGTRRGDGANALASRPASRVRIEPLEVAELRYPLIRWRYELDPDSGGAGKWRGGLGVIVEQEYCAKGIASMGAIRTSGAWPLHGIDGGHAPKRLSGVITYVGTDHEVGPPSCLQGNLPVQDGDRSIAWTAGGGGYGDPLERAPQRVIDDLRNGYVSREAVSDLYGVVLDEAGCVNEALTAFRRADLRKSASTAKQDESV